MNALQELHDRDMALKILINASDDAAQIKRLKKERRKLRLEIEELLLRKRRDNDE